MRGPLESVDLNATMHVSRRARIRYRLSHHLTSGCIRVVAVLSKVCV